MGHTYSWVPVGVGKGFVVLVLAWLFYLANPTVPLPLMLISNNYFACKTQSQSLLLKNSESLATCKSWCWEWPRKTGNRMRFWSCITCHPAGYKDPISCERWSTEISWNNVVLLLKLSSVVNWESIWIENALATAICQTFEKNEGNSHYKDWVCSGTLRKPLSTIVQRYLSEIVANLIVKFKWILGRYKNFH